MRDLSGLADHPHQAAPTAVGGPAGEARRRRRDGPRDRGARRHGRVRRQGLLADLVGEGARAVVARGGRGGRGNVSLRERPRTGSRAPPRPASRRGAASARRAAHGRRRRARGPAERRQVHAARRAHRREAEDRELPVHDAHAQPRRRGWRRRPVRRRRHPRADRGRQRGRGPRAPVPAPRRALPRARAGRGPVGGGSVAATSRCCGTSSPRYDAELARRARPRGRHEGRPGRRSGRAAASAGCARRLRR